MDMPESGGAATRTVDVDVPSNAVLVGLTRCLSGSFIAEDGSAREGVVLVVDGRINGGDETRIHLLLTWPDALELFDQINSRYGEFVNAVP